MKRAFVYIDDSKDVVETFKKSVRENWNLDYDVISNSKYGQIKEKDYEAFKNDIIKFIGQGIPRIDCVFLDLDFSGTSGKEDRTGFLIGRAIREQWPRLPIILTTRLTEYEISKKGMIFDFDNLIQPGELIRLSVDEFEGIVSVAQKKRQNILNILGDIPISYQNGKHLYFRHIQKHVEEKKHVFVAMPFDESIVRKDVFDLVIKESCKEVGLNAIRVDENKKTISIIDEIVKLIFTSKILIADITGENPNVMYELGIAHTTNIPCITLKRKGTKLQIPFDIRHIKTIIYEQEKLTDLKSELTEVLREWNRD